MLIKTPRLPGEARLTYLDATYRIEAPGDFVQCAVTGKKIPVPELKYWSIDRQEAYADAAAANAAMLGKRDAGE